MRVRIQTLLALAVIVTAVPALAQEPGTVEAGLFWRGWMWGHQTQLKDDWAGGGGRLGLFFLRNVELEAAAAYNQVDHTSGLTANVVPLTARLVWNAPVTEDLALLLGAGFTHIKYGGDFDAQGNGLDALAGLRLKASDHVSLRLEGTLDRLHRPLNSGAQTAVGDFGVQAGLSWCFGGSPRDSDQDGVPDNLDMCPDTPRGLRVDARGCRIIEDSDHDGVSDALDKCPDTPAGTRVDASGCPIIADSDGDGVPDSQDKCPDTPIGTRVDATGCPVPVDSDSDGVYDAQDKCPNTPIGTPVDANGCPRVFEEGKKNVVLEGVNFATNKAELLPESRATLDRVAESLRAYPELMIEVQGHTDSRGSAGLNRRLSQARAEAVRDYLIANGVAASRLTAKGYGPSMPIADNNTAEGRAKNRRVELVKSD
ncbi:MAG: OmpA family protein [Candidatus Krumholzibacteriia bacterium]